MDLSPFKLDIDELIQEFVEGEFKRFADMKRIWISRKFSYIFEAIPSIHLPLVMQSLFSHSISHLITTNSLSHRLGGLYCLYCFCETQPFKPAFKVYLSLGELRRLKILLVDAKKEGINAVSSILSRMLERNMFLFGSVDMNDYAGTERIKDLIDLQNARVRKMQEKLLLNENIESYLYMDMGMELDLKAMKKISREYADAKELAIKEASRVVDVENVKHIAENKTSVGDDVEVITQEWNNRKEMFYQQTGFGQHPAWESMPEKNNLWQTESLCHQATERQQEDKDLDEPTSFMQLLTAGGQEWQQDNRDTQPEESDRLPANRDDREEDSEYANDLEKLLSEM
ncbi:hypothetical protein Nepgr_020806 [Nepenthes gracilis]|uniref:Uncharacterized protein n=1 Tax=Nepenthes gracilis TaxID=150966 RepID=A0AAD3SVY0_NEPGR|nr:hypothetical protein Nepgr_020806 [Nepenthes gracilis]